MDTKEFWNRLSKYLENFDDVGWELTVFDSKRCRITVRTNSYDEYIYDSFESLEDLEHYLSWAVSQEV